MQAVEGLMIFIKIQNDKLAEVSPGHRITKEMERVSFGHHRRQTRWGGGDICRFINTTKSAVKNTVVFSFICSKVRKPRFHPRVLVGLLEIVWAVMFPFFLTHHLKAVRRRESSFTTENSAKINFLLLFLALAGQRKHDRFHSFCPQGFHLYLKALIWNSLDIFGGLLLLPFDCMWHVRHLPSSHRQNHLSMQVHV